VTCRFQLWSVPDLWNLRASGRGVLIYWHVERGSVVIHSQRLNCSASEVHAMVDGAIRHGTDMHVEANYVDSHGQSEIGFGITKLLGFDLLPRIKRIKHRQALPPRDRRTRRLARAGARVDSPDYWWKALIRSVHYSLC